MTDSSATIPVQRLTPTDSTPAERTLPVEMPIAVEYNGIGYAVMMATPTDLHDFVIGFSLSERIVTRTDEVQAIHAHETPQGIVLRITIAQDRMEPMQERVRVRVSESSCGLCGLENLEQVARPLPPISAHLDVAPSAIFAALERLRDHQPLNKATGGAHAAAFCAPDGSILHAREDVGRHCALDKLIGALAAADVSPASGFILLSSRCSYELVEKTVIAGCPLLVTISTATTLAAERAKAAGLTLIALARSDAMLRLG
ncbi:formate dehydrogenase accessory sulfurtransferase FdhD [Chakrabartia godavariana]|nr:formate dehydrogenase accessory sulfurtransferase FdhD [Chakrabartia godavariana]